jgi:protein phosphatase
MKVVIISDLHANMEALGGLPSDFDELWVLGDLVNYGPDPAKCVEFIRNEAAVVIRGNHDNAIGLGTDPRCSPAFRTMAAAMQAYTESALSSDQKRYLRELPITIEREVEGRRVMLCHAIPSDPLFGYCNPDDPRWAEEVRRTGVDILLVGHTHLPFVRWFGPRQIVNPGSLGQPKGGTVEACYAVWCDAGFKLRSFAYPFEETIQKIDRLPIAGDVKAGLAAVLRNGGLGQHNDMETNSL